HKDTQAMMIGMIASFALSLAATPVEATGRLPPRFHGEWCQTYSGEYETVVAGKREKRPDPITRYELCSWRPANAPKTVRITVGEREITILYPNGAKTTCTARIVFARENENLWTGRFDCEGGLDSFRFSRGKDEHGRYTEPPTLTIRDE